MKNLRMGLLSLSMLVWALPTGAAPNVTNPYGWSYGMATTGNGRLSAMIGWRGELITLRWPTATHYDHMRFRTTTQVGGRELDYFGANPNEASFAGLWIEAESGGEMSWLREAPWMVEVSYESQENDIVRTEYIHPTYGIRVIESTLIAPDLDVLARRYEVDLSGAEITTAATLVYYANFAPHQKKEPFFPTEDYSKDDEHGFATVYDEACSRFLTFVPQEEDRDVRDDLLADFEANGDAALFFDEAQDRLGEGIYLATGADFEPAGWQVGLDAYDGEGEEGPTDAYLDAEDGTLEGSLWAVDHENIALAKPVGRAHPRPLTVFIALGGSAYAALETLDRARSDGWEALRERVNARWADHLAGVRLPNDDPQLESFAQRTMIAVANGTDAATGAIVASISVQSPYFLDWPRDGAFFNFGLDVAGYRDLVSRREHFYYKIQRQSDDQDNSIFEPKGPAGSWAMNYYSDGMAGGPINWEIDQAGLILWTWWEHAKFLHQEDPQAAADYLYPLTDGIVLTADLLTTCVDEATGLQCLANEDDHPEPSIGIHGASTTWLGLTSAVLAAQAMGLDESIWGPWETRRWELHEAIMIHEFDDEILNAWSIWPGRFFERDDPRWETQIDHHLEQLDKRLVNREVEVVSYDAKATLALAHLLRDPEDPRRERLWRHIEILAKEVPTPTQHMGEVYAPLGESGWDNYVSIPHLWESTLVYLSIIGFQDPSIFDLEETFLLPDPSPDASLIEAIDASPDLGDLAEAPVCAVQPPVGDDDDADDDDDGGDDGGCSCRIAPESESGSRAGVWAPTFLLLLALRFRRRLGRV